MSSNEPDTTELPRYRDGDTTVTLPATTPEETTVRLPDRSGFTVVVGSALYQDDTAASRTSPESTAKLPVMRAPFTVKRLVQPLTGSRLIKGLLAGNVLVLCLALGLFIGGLWVANETGVIPDSVKPGILKNSPEPRKSPEQKEHPTPTTPRPSNRQKVVKPAAPSPDKTSSSPEASASPSASSSPSLSVSASAPAQPETSPSATQPAPTETTAPGTTPSAPASTASSPEAEPTSSAPAAPPTSGTASANPEKADPTVTP